MTKLEKLKESIGYTKENAQCRNCVHFRMDVEPGGWNGSYSIEKNLKCHKYGFSTKKTTTCNEHERNA